METTQIVAVNIDSIKNRVHDRWYVNDTARVMNEISDEIRRWIFRCLVSILAAHVAPVRQNLFYSKIKRGISTWETFERNFREIGADKLDQQ